MSKEYKLDAKEFWRSLVITREMASSLLTLIHKLGGETQKAAALVILKAAEDREKDLTFNPKYPDLTASITPRARAVLTRACLKCNKTRLIREPNRLCAQCRHENESSVNADAAMPMHEDFRKIGIK